MAIRSPFWNLAFALLLLPLIAVAASAASGDYKFGQQDKIRIKVYQWLEALGEFQDWPALNGDFTVADNGQLLLPLIGEVPAAGQSSVQLGGVIADRLQAKLNLPDKPNVLVDVVAFRPFYVVGVVEHPGEYTFRPGMTVLHAISVAGGLKQITDSTQWQPTRDLVTFKGELRLLNQNLMRLKARQARLDAERQRLEAIAFPPELTDNASEQFAGIVKEEQAVFDGRRESAKQLVASVESQKVLSQNQIAVLESRIEVSVKQQKTTEDALRRIRRSLAKGYLTTVRILTMQRSIADLESAQLEFKTRIVSAQQDLAKLDKEILDMQALRQNEVLTGLQDTNAKIAETLDRLETNQSLIHEAENAGSSVVAASPADAATEPVRFIIRRGGQIVNGGSSLDMAIEPGDLITFERTPSLPAQSG